MTLRTTPAPLNWNLLRAFSEIVQYRSLADAARAAGVQRPTVSEKITALEARLGLQLMDRRGGNAGFRLTPHGNRLRRLLLDFNGQLAALSSAASAPSPDEKGTDILRDVEEALSALERARKALHRT